MAEENTAINDLIHLAATPRVENDPDDQMFWGRDGVNLHGPAVKPVFEEDDELTVRVDRFAAATPAAMPILTAAAYAPPTGPADLTMRVSPLDMPLPTARRPSVIDDLLATIRRHVVPLAGLAVLAIFIGGYLAFHVHHTSKPRVAAPPALSVTPIAAPTTPPISAALASALVADAVVVEPVVEPAREPTITTVNVDEPDPDPEIEMAPIEITKRRHRSRVRPIKVSKRSAVIASVPAKSPTKRVHARTEQPAKRTAAVTEAALPPNTANKTTATGAGKLVVTSNKPAMIYLDGRSTRQMTPKKFAVPAGAHKITLLEPTSRKAKTQDVEIIAGKVAAVDKQF